MAQPRAAVAERRRAEPLKLAGEASSTRSGASDPVSRSLEPPLCFRPPLPRRSSPRGTVRLQYQREFLDHERALRLKPDITWWRGGRLAAVIDAKYKQLVDARFPNADAYQMLAYCAGLGQRLGFLVHARDADQRSRTHRVRDGRTTLEVRAMDLEATPDEVVRQVDDLAREVVGSSRRPQGPRAGVEGSAFVRPGALRARLRLGRTAALIDGAGELVQSQGKASVLGAVGGALSWRWRLPAALRGALGFGGAGSSLSMVHETAKPR